MQQPWWQDAVVYQIYPKSFSDTNGDGIGDLGGIIGKLDYLTHLGVNTLWLCPTFPSPMVDNGYDVSDYRGVHPDFGTLEDMDALITEAKRRDMHILLDLVLNHSSDQHPWFQSAVDDHASPYRDYYIFRDGVDGGPPNNWRSNFGGSTWEQDATGQYYFHTFAKEQPDLNWENPKLRGELYDFIHWWMDRGIAGFRIDAICFIKKDPAFPCLPPDGPDGLANPDAHWMVHPGIEAFLGEMRDKVFLPRGAFTVAEANGVQPHQLDAFIGENGFFSTIFDFSYTDIDIKNGNWHECSHFTRRQLRDAIFASQKAVCRSGHGALYLENHDQYRSPNKYLSKEEIGYESVTMLGMLYFFLQGIPFVYQGQELGMVNHPWQSLDQFDDVVSADQYQRAVAAGLSPEEALAVVAHRARDNSRTPMLWEEGVNRGFTTGTPWLPVYPGGDVPSAAVQWERDDSVYTFYRRMVALRKGPLSRLFFAGDFQPRYEESDVLFAYERELDGQRVLVVCNFSAEATAVTLPAGALLLGNQRGAGKRVSNDNILAPFEALLLQLD